MASNLYKPGDRRAGQGGAPLSEAQPLGINTKFVTPPSGFDDDRQRAFHARVRRFALQSTAVDLLPGERVSWCLRRLTFDQHTVQVWVAEEAHKAHLKNLAVCGSVWTCPVCSAKITERRRVEMSEALEKTDGHLTPILITVTFQHNRKMSLTESLGVLTDAYRRLRRGNPWKRIAEEYGLVASVTGLETTWGNENGWHPHKHALYFSELQPGEIDPEALKKRITGRWKAILDRLGYYASDLYAVDVQIGDEKAGDYVGKWGLEHELVKSPVKNGRGGYSPFQLLELYQQGKSWAGGLFQEYAEAMKGRKQLVWSRGGREVVGLVEPEKTDEELANEPESVSYLLAELTWKQFSVILSQVKIRPGLIGETLEIASIGDPVRFWTFLTSLGVRPSETQINLAIFPEVLRSMGVERQEAQKRAKQAKNIPEDLPGPGGDPGGAVVDEFEGPPLFCGEEEHWYIPAAQSALDRVEQGREIWKKWADKNFKPDREITNEDWNRFADRIRSIGD